MWSTNTWCSLPCIILCKYTHSYSLNHLYKRLVVCVCVPVFRCQATRADSSMSARTSFGAWPRSFSGSSGMRERNLRSSREVHRVGPALACLAHVGTNRARDVNAFSCFFHLGCRFSHFALVALGPCRDHSLSFERFLGCAL